MINRLENALQNGQEIMGADASFYLHEPKETELMLTMDYSSAHQAVLEFYEVSPFSVYHPDVIQQNAKWFGNSWFEFWGLKK